MYHNVLFFCLWAFGYFISVGYNKEYFWEHSSIPPGKHMCSFLAANLPRSKISKSKGYALVQPK